MNPVSVCCICLCILSMRVHVNSPPIATGIQVRPKAAQTTQTPQSPSPSVCVSCLSSLSQSILSLFVVSLCPTSVYPIYACTCHPTAYGDRYSSQTKSCPDNPGPTRPFSLCLSCLCLSLSVYSVFVCLSLPILSLSVYSVFVSLCLSCLCIVSFCVCCLSVVSLCTCHPTTHGDRYSSQTKSLPDNPDPTKPVSLGLCILSLQSLSVYPVSAVSLSLSCLCSLSQSILSLQSLSEYPVSAVSLSLSCLCLLYLCVLPVCIMSMHVHVNSPPMVTGIQVRPKATQTTQTPQGRPCTPQQSANVGTATGTQGAAATAPGGG